MKVANLITLFMCIGSCATGQNHSELNDRLSELSDQREFFRLRDEISANRHILPKDMKLYWDAVCASIFDRCEESNLMIEEYFSRFGKSADKTFLGALLKIKADNLVRTYRYKEGYLTYLSILEQYPDLLEEDEKHDLENNVKLWRSVQDVPPQEVTIEKDYIIPYNKNSYNHMLVPVSVNGTGAEYIFDTGAGLSLIGETGALEMGMTIYDTDVQVGTATSIMLESKLACAEELYVGDLKFKNVLFLVVPDEQLNFEEIDFYIKGVVGFPVIHQMREIRIDGNSITVPYHTRKLDTGNLCLDGLTPVTYGIANGERLDFTLDTGANGSELSYRYYTRHKDEIEEHGKLADGRRGGGGGIIDETVYRISDFTIGIGGREITIPSMSVSTAEYLFNQFKDGNIGLDVLFYHGGFTLSFQDMYLDLSY